MVSSFSKSDTATPKTDFNVVTNITYLGSTALVDTIFGSYTLNLSDDGVEEMLSAIGQADDVTVIHASIHASPEVKVLAGN